VRTRGFLGLALAWALASCGNDDGTDEARPLPVVPSDHAAVSAREEVEVALVPILNREALSARVTAQRNALGADMPLFEDERGRPVPWIAPQGMLPDEPSLDDALLDSLEGSSGLGGGGVGANVRLPGKRISGNMLGLYEPIAAMDAGAPLDRFHRALRDLHAGRDPDGKVRVAIYGASHTEADVYPHYVRSYLRERFGDGGHGFVHVAPPWRGYQHLEVAVDGLDHWQTDHAQRRDGRDDGYYGLLGASISARHRRAWGRVTPAAGVVASRYEIYFLAQPKGGAFELFVDGHRHATVSTHAQAIGPGYHAFAVPEGEHTIEVRPLGDGEVRLFGMTMERDRTGVVVDTLGIRGTRATNALEWDETIWADNLRHRAPDLVMLAFGTNEATDTNSPIEDYEARLRVVVDRIARNAPQASCLLIGPGDFPDVMPDGTLGPRPRVTQIIATQQRVASEMGCGFWDLRAFMGGELSMLQWVSADPPMARNDFVHLTRRGYVRMGMALVDAIMNEFDGGDPLRGR